MQAPRQAKVRAQVELAKQRFGDAVRHKKYGHGLVVDSSNRASVAVYWLDPKTGPPWRGPRVRARMLTHDWDMQAEWPDVCTHFSDGEWEA